MRSERLYREALGALSALPWRQPGAGGRHFLRLALRPVQVGHPVTNELTATEGNTQKREAPLDLRTNTTRTIANVSRRITGRRE